MIEAFAIVSCIFAIVCLVGLIAAFASAQRAQDQIVQMANEQSKLLSKAMDVVVTPEADQVERINAEQRSGRAFDGLGLRPFVANGRIQPDEPNEMTVDFPMGGGMGGE